MSETQADTVDRFIEVNKRLFELVDEDGAKAHIAALQNQGAGDLAESLWQMEKCQRAINEREVQ